MSKDERTARGSEGPLTISVIGTLPPPIGGAAVSLQHLVDLLSARTDVATIVVNTSGVRGGGVRGPLRFARIVARIVASTARADVVSLQAAPTGVPLIGPIVAACARVRRKPLLVRLFGGVYFDEYGFVRRSVSRWVVRRADLLLLQTRRLIEAAERDGITHVAWYPTSRPRGDDDDDRTPRPPRAGNGPCRRFVYLGHVKETKGIREIIAAGERFGDEVSVDVYGPFLEQTSERSFEGLERVRYCGVVPPGKGVEVLREYDALLLPTYWPGEGYPGIIIESFNAGLPIITTKWLAIPEIVDETCGILVEPRDADDLYEAMQRLVSDRELFLRLQAGAWSKRRLFDSQVWVERFVDHCRSLATRTGP